MLYEDFANLDNMFFYFSQLIYLVVISGLKESYFSYISFAVCCILLDLFRAFSIHNKVV